MPELTGRKRFAHLYRRAGFGATEFELDAAMAAHPVEDVAFDMAVDELLAYESIPEVPDRIVVDPAVSNTLIQWWLERMVRTQRPLLEKMVFFWHDHFATALNKGGLTVARVQRQNEFFRANALGMFQDILNGISRDPAMIFWLDLNSNRKNSPNENYARELMELFSLGVGDPADPNYTEADIKQATKAFTGYSVDVNDEFFLNPAQHDSSIKVVLGQDCESGDDVNRILVTYRKAGRQGAPVCARFIAAKLFSFFAYRVTPADAVVSRFADAFESSGLSVRVLVERILKSPEFASRAAYRARIKTPVEVGVGALRMLEAERVPLNGVLNRLIEQGQRLFYPPNVGGWPSGRNWITVSTMLSRCNMAATIVNSLGKLAETEAGGAPVATFLDGLTTAPEKVDRILGLLVDGEVTSRGRQALITYAESATTDETIRGLFNLVMAQPAYQLN